MNRPATQIIESKRGKAYTTKYANHLCYGPLETTTYIGRKSFSNALRTIDLLQ